MQTSHWTSLHTINARAMDQYNGIASALTIMKLFKLLNHMKIKVVVIINNASMILEK